MILDKKAILIAGCGFVVPEIQEFWASPGDTSIKVNAIASQVQCELRESVRSLLADDLALAARNGTNPQLGWLTSWSAQVTLTLTILESSSLNPGVALNAPLNNALVTYGPTTITVPQSYSTGFGGNFSSAATRTDAITAIYNLGDFAGKPPKNISCIPEQVPNGTLFIQSDLKLKQWLYEALLPQYTGIIQYPQYAANVKNGFISHEIKFEIVSIGNATPTWKLIRVSANTGNSPLVNFDRDRTQDLLITLGPTLATPPPPPGVARIPALSTAAENSHLAAQIGAAVAAAIKNPQ
jgi:hypothetical protein